MTKLLSYALALALAGCSSGPYSDIKGGSYVEVRTISGKSTFGKVGNQTSKGILIYSAGDKPIFIPWTSIEVVKGDNW
jgi:hypothetical protein